jgi:hypothetical protein
MISVAKMNMTSGRMEKCSDVFMSLFEVFGIYYVLSSLFCAFGNRVSAYNVTSPAIA